MLHWNSSSSFNFLVKRAAALNRAARSTGRPISHPAKDFVPAKGRRAPSWKELKPAKQSPCRRLGKGKQTYAAWANCPSSDAILLRIGLSTNKASPTTIKFIAAVTTKTMCQLPVLVLITLASGTRNADAPFAV
jgi:hypothetical protein